MSEVAWAAIAPRGAFWALSCSERVRPERIFSMMRSASAIVAGCLMVVLTSYMSRTSGDLYAMRFIISTSASGEGPVLGTRLIFAPV